MVSRIRYHSFKQFDLKKRVPLFGIVLVMLVIGFVAWQPPLILFVVASSYVLSGPLHTLWSKRRRPVR